MRIAPAWPQCLAFFGTPLVMELSLGQLAGDAGLRLVRQFDQRIGLTRHSLMPSTLFANRTSPSIPIWRWSGPAKMASWGLREPERP